MGGVVFGTPTFDKTVTIDYLYAMVSTSRDLALRGVEVQTYYVVGNCFIDLARNEIVHHFLNETDADDLFFIDSDVGWPHEAVARFLEHPAEIVAGLVPKREDKASYHMSALTGVVENNYLQTVEAPTAFMRIKRSVFKKLDEAYPRYRKMRPPKEGHTPYFQTGFENGTFRGEDIFFCHQWAAMGGYIWVYPDISFTHRGSKPYAGNFYHYGRETGLFNVSEPSSGMREQPQENSKPLGSNGVGTAHHP